MSEGINPKEISDLLIFTLIDDRDPIPWICIERKPRLDGECVA
jgi:hypothetical protein